MAYFQQRRGYSLLPLLPALFVDVGEKTPGARYDFQLTLAERLDEAYYRQLSAWCDQHGIALTGHPAGATEIYPLRYFQTPGQDIVWRGVVPEGHRALEGTNSAIGKCSSSVARHDGRRFNSNEVYGAYGWQLTMEEMKWLADWLMVRGVNRLYPHAFYYSIRDYRVNERPPDLGPNNLWWPHYRLFADYTARLCGLLTDSRQVCDVAILAGNHDLPWRAAKWLYQHQIDFNYVEDWRLILTADVADGSLRVGPMAYSLLIVDQDGPPAGPIGKRLEELLSAGLTVRHCRGEPDAGLVAGLARDVLVEPEVPDLRFVHLVKNGIHFYTGTLRYRTTFALSRKTGSRYELDLGQVGDFVVARLNGQELPARFWRPFSWDVTPAARDGENELVVEVTNSLVNRYDAKIRRPSGLFGPVQLRETGSQSAK
ncbi:MAG: hypothetical protein HY718_19385 [Planctomycetes bacterium]|nr:hypothetical protein [Planctomycetota bacterium]